VLAQVVARISHTQDYGLGQWQSTVSGQVRGVDQVRQACDIQHLRGTVISDHHGLKHALGASFEVNVCPVDCRCPIWILDGLRGGDHEGRAGLGLDHRQASRQLHLEIDALYSLFASNLNDDLGFLLACQDPMLCIRSRLGAQNQTWTVLGNGNRRPGAAQNSKHGEDKGQVHGL